MSKAFRYIMIFMVLLVMAVFSFASAENTESYDLTKELDRIKTHHDGGFVKEEAITDDDLHYGWGLGVFYIQGWSKMTWDTDGIPVFLLQDNEQIMLGFRLTQQDLDALGGNSKYRVNSDTNGYDSGLGVKQQNFGKGCLILQRTDKTNYVEEPAVYPDYLASAADDPQNTLVGPLGEGSYKGALDYEVQYAGVANIPGYNDYRIAFSFKIENIKDFYSTAAASTNISPSGTQLITILVAVGGIIILFAALFIVIRKRNPRPGKKEFSENSDSYSRNVFSDDGSEKHRHLKKWQIFIIFLIVLAICIFAVRPILTTPASYPASIQYLDEKMKNANLLMVGTASASVIISLLPDDFGTPIANELAQITGYMLVVTSAIVLERYLITSIGFVASVIIPAAAFIMGVLWLALYDKDKKRILAEYAVRLVIFGICIAMIIPLGCLCGRGIEAMNNEQIAESLSDAAEAKRMADELESKKEDKSAVTRFVEGIGQTVSTWITNLFSEMIHSISIFVITTIVIPVLIMLAFIWVIRFLTKKDFTNLILGYSKHIADQTASGITNTARNAKHLRGHGEDQ